MAGVDTSYLADQAELDAMDDEDRNAANRNIAFNKANTVASAGLANADGVINATYGQPLPLAQPPVSPATTAGALPIAKTTPTPSPLPGGGAGEGPLPTPRETPDPMAFLPPPSAGPTPSAPAVTSTGSGVGAPIAPAGTPAAPVTPPSNGVTITTPDPNAPGSGYVNGMRIMGLTDQGQYLLDDGHGGTVTGPQSGPELQAFYDAQNKAVLANPRLYADQGTPNALPPGQPTAPATPPTAPTSGGSGKIGDPNGLTPSDAGSPAAPARPSTGLLPATPAPMPWEAPPSTGAEYPSPQPAPAGTPAAPVTPPSNGVTITTPDPNAPGSGYVNGMRIMGLTDQGQYLLDDGHGGTVTGPQSGPELQAFYDAQNKAVLANPRLYADQGTTNALPPSQAPAAPTTAPVPTAGGAGNIGNPNGLTPSDAGSPSAPARPSTGALPATPAPMPALPPTPQMPWEAPPSAGQELPTSAVIPASANGLPSLPAAPAAPAPVAPTVPAPVIAPTSSAGLNGLPASSGALDAARLSPTTPSNALTNSTITPGPATDRYAIARQEYDDWQKQTDPQFQASMRDSNRWSAAAGRIGSGQATNSIGDIQTQRENDMRTKRDSFLGGALTGSIDDAYRNIGIEQQQQEFQSGQQKTAFDQSVRLQQLTDSEQGVQYSQTMQAMGFNAQQIQQAFKNAFDVAKLADDQTGAAFYRALQQEIYGSQGNPADYMLQLARQWAAPNGFTGTAA